MTTPETDLCPPAETLHIQNFAGITDATIELSRMNVFIGPQASGKSVCAKLLFYFRERVNNPYWLVSENGEDTKSEREEHRTFNTLFPPLKRGEGRFHLLYSIGDLTMTVTEDPKAQGQPLL